MNGPYEQALAERLQRIREAEQAAQQAIDQVEKNAEPDWMAEAEAEVMRLTALHDEITTDDIWDGLTVRKVPPPHEPRAMGALMRRMQSRGVLIPSGRYRKSRRKECHGRPVMVWWVALGHN